MFTQEIIDLTIDSPTTVVLTPQNFVDLSMETPVDNMFSPIAPTQLDFDAVVAPPRSFDDFNRFFETLTRDEMIEFMRIDPIDTERRIFLAMAKNIQTITNRMERIEYEMNFQIQTMDTLNDLITQVINN